MHVQQATKDKRLLLTAEILADMGYEDSDALQLLHEGSSLAGEIQATPVFKSQYKPCMSTMAQLEAGSFQRNSMILSMTKSSGNSEMDEQMLKETKEELDRGWARGPFALHELPPGSG